MCFACCGAQELQELREELSKEQVLRNKLALRLMGAQSTIHKLKGGGQGGGALEVGGKLQVYAPKEDTTQEQSQSIGN